MSCGGQFSGRMDAETFPVAARLLPMEGAGDGCFPRRKTARRTGGICFTEPCVATWAKLPMTFRRCRASISPIVQRRFGEVEKGIRAERKAASGGAEKCHAEADVPGSGDGVTVVLSGRRKWSVAWWGLSEVSAKG